jgi:hypothetical protein
MADKDIKKYDEFVRRVADLAKELKVSPSEGLHLFGQIARGFVEHSHARGDGEFEALAEQALNRFATGFGGEVSDVTVKPAPDGGLH